MPLAPMRRRPSRPPLPSRLFACVMLLSAMVSGGCATPDQRTSPMVCPSTPEGCAKEDVPWYRQDVTAMIPPPPVDPAAPPEQSGAATTGDDAAPATAAADASPAALPASEPIVEPVVSSFAVTPEPASPAPAAPSAEGRDAAARTGPAAASPDTEQLARAAEPLVRLPSDELFELGGATLGPAGRRALDALADRLHGTAYTHIHVIARTDRTGQAMTNLKLSWQRARIVRDHLATRGIPGEVLDHEGRGSRDASIDPDRCGHQRAARIRCLAPDRHVDIVVTQRTAP